MIKPNYETTNRSQNGRVGELQLQRNGEKIEPIETPFLYPVTSFMTGVSTRGGGLWKYLLRYFMRYDQPMLTQVLHFLDFNLSPKHLDFWREMSFRDRYFNENGKYDAPIFLDSGGFKLLYTDFGNLKSDLDSFGIRRGKEAEDILDLQIDFGGEMVASLDYPLPPNLVRSEAIERMDRSLKNARLTAEALSDLEDPPFLYVCCHGQSREDIENYVRSVFDLIGDLLPSFGLAVGSLVPLRGQKDHAVLERIIGTINAIPETVKDKTPIHAFGVSGNLTPILAFLGVDTFDSTSYIQAARSLSYVDPQTYRKLKILEIDEISCQCRICKNEIDLDEMHTAFMEKASYRRTSTGKFKSEYYAQIALHNFELEAEILQKMKGSIIADQSLEGIVQHSKNFQRGLRSAIAWLSEFDDRFAKQISREIFINKKSENYNPDQLEFPKFLNESQSITYATPNLKPLEIREDEVSISLKYTPDSFKIPIDYAPPIEKKILLSIPCAGKKPYSNSRTHTIVKNKLTESFGDQSSKIHKITISGLYGPVPEEFENETAVVRYDFHLGSNNRDQIEMCAKRFENYLDRFANHYQLIIAYATTKAYRSVFETVQRNRSDLILLPENPKSKRLSEFFRHIHLDALIETIDPKME